MKTTKEIHHMIATSETRPSEETIRRILDILEALNKRIAHNECTAHQAVNYIINDD